VLASPVALAKEYLSSEEMQLLEAVKSKDERAFSALGDAHTPALKRLARVYSVNAEEADELVHETWIGFLDTLATYEGRASLRTWLARILLNRARKRWRTRGRVVPFSELFDAGSAPHEATVDPDRFLDENAQWPYHWADAPRPWSSLPEERLLSQEVLDQVREAIAALPPSQREVITLRDIEGWSAPEVCNVLEISETNQRVLLHRARARVRKALESFFEDEADG
jgi:RNA polymerase sigma-70 factor (ECF subfamily)